ncbi:threonine synthase [Motilibacter peucedani]|uniref:Threonine synthase n=1 Tax=Motilibacter peucedani TaxID=598650 RepID=A0A420XPY1_9ACTN|nr:threonine synthase [Motilibacter peucedani]RKS75304.1 threonine synthase [Motilibacter peucedani]
MSGSLLAGLACARCGKPYDADVLQGRCADDGATLLPQYDLSPGAVDRDAVAARPADLWRWTELLPLRHPGPPALSLGEAATPLVTLRRTSERLGVEVLLKDESPLPGTTFKARGAAVALARAIELGIPGVVLPTAGNAGGTWALYAARAGVPAAVVMAESAPLVNQAEVLTAGAELHLVPGTLAEAGARARELAAERGWFLAATFGEPYRVDGKKTAWLEVFHDLGWRWPGTVVFPVGGGVGLVAASEAVEQAQALGWAGDGPRLVAVQSEDCAPLVRAWDAGGSEVARWEGVPRTVAAGLRVTAPSEGWLVLERVRRSGGTVLGASEGDVLDAVSRLAREEGVYASPEGAATLVAAERLAARGELEEPVVLYQTASAAKYPEALRPVPAR